MPDERAARSLAGDLAEYGFALVTARPDFDGWVVVAFDEGPYPDDECGHR